MKKLALFVLSVIMLVSIFAVPALAAGDETTHWAFGFTAQTNGSTLTHAEQYHTKLGACTIIEVRHQVIGSGSSYGFTNYMYGYILNKNIYAGGKWQLPNNVYWSCTSTNLEQGDIVTPGGRGNTKYAEQGLSSVRLEGQFHSH